MGDVRKVFGVKGFPLTGMPECKETKCIVMTAYAGLKVLYLIIVSSFILGNILKNDKLVIMCYCYKFFFKTIDRKSVKNSSQ
jgi:hypothetical protein